MIETKLQPGEDLLIRQIQLLQHPAYFLHVGRVITSPQCNHFRS
ncbi:hypothetical protein UUU_12570 [Klebsiella pneumoniae subsp. pneumoniae DSM 30104 = JCM 1662 = NBRC 14940]|nr:hypothetical protein UUU_12570 [Klebsiella pneumoniae subsp. pneumoniae DSM 30104 = JCM 1662 = NBRC 14940]